MPLFTLAAQAPESDQILPFVESFIEELVGDFTITPFIDLGLRPPPPIADRVPELAVVLAKWGEPPRCASKIGNLGRR